MIHKLSQEFINIFKIHPDCILEINDTHAVFDYALVLFSSKINSSKMITSKVHFFKHPLTGNISVLLCTDSVWHLKNSKEMASAQILLEEIHKTVGKDAALIDQDNDFRVRLSVNNLENNLKDTILVLTSQVSQLASLVFDVFSSL